jgi:hypothetical protein
LRAASAAPPSISAKLKLSLASKTDHNPQPAPKHPSGSLPAGINYRFQAHRLLDKSCC